MMFKKGDLVRLKSGGPDMTTEEVSTSGVKCLWLGDDNKMCQSVFPEVCLVAVEPVSK